MANNSQVAIMMPVYNGVKTLPLAIASLINQTYPYWKCYVVNDGSTDGTKALLDNFNDPRFVVIHFEKNKGRPYARQAALDAAEGKYLAFLDADDFYHPNKLQEQVSLLETNPDLKLVSCGMGSYDVNNNLITIRSNYNSSVQTYSIGQLYRPARAAALVYLDRAKEYGYNLSLRYAQDTDFFMRYLDGQKYLNTSSIHYYYSEFSSVSKKKIITTNIYGILLYKQFFKKKPIFVSKRISINTLKILAKLIIYPFVNANFYLKRRGMFPSEKDIQNFKNALILNSKSLKQK